MEYVNGLHSTLSLLNKGNLSNDNKVIICNNLSSMINDTISNLPSMIGYEEAFTEASNIANALSTETNKGYPVISDKIKAYSKCYNESVNMDSNIVEFKRSIDDELKVVDYISESYVKSVDKAIDQYVYELNEYNDVKSSYEGMLAPIRDIKELLLRYNNGMSDDEFNNVMRKYTRQIIIMTKWLYCMRDDLTSAYQATTGRVSGMDIVSNNFMESLNQLDSMYAKLEFQMESYTNLCVFEEADDETASQQSPNIIKRLIDGTRKLLTKIIKSVVNFFDVMFAGKNARFQYEEFKKQLAAHPELKDKKITMRDMKKINAMYEDAVKNIDKEIAIMRKKYDEELAQARQDEVDRRQANLDAADNKAQEVIDKITGKTNQIKNITGSIVNIDLALRMAESNRHVAKFIRNQLENEEGYLKRIEDDLGEKRAKDFKRKIKSSSKLLSLHRLKIRILGQQHNDMSSALNQTVTDFNKIFGKQEGVIANTVGRVSNTRLVGDFIGGAKKVTGNENLVKDTVKTVGTAAGIAIPAAASVGASVAKANLQEKAMDSKIGKAAQKLSKNKDQRKAESVRKFFR